MTKNKTLYLGVIHSKQVEAPSIKELINNPMYEDDVKAAIDKLKGSKKTINHAFKLVQRKYRTEVAKEHTFLTDQSNYKDNDSACIIIDVDNRKVVKNRFHDANLDEMVELYLGKYKNDIEEFNRRFRS